MSYLRYKIKYKIIKIMSDLDCLLSLSLCCFACKECTECIDDTSSPNSYKKIEEKKEDEKKENLNVIFFYDQNDKRIDANINRIIFYEEYQKGYYNEYDIDKNILFIKNKNNNIKDISSIINFIHSNNGLSLKNNDKKWFPKYIWVYN